MTSRSTTRPNDVTASVIRGDQVDPSRMMIYQIEGMKKRDETSLLFKKKSKVKEFKKGQEAQASAETARTEGCRVTMLGWKERR